MLTKRRFLRALWNYSKRDMDINKFTKIATSDKEDTSHIERVKELFKEGVVDVYEDDVFSSLVTNQKLWDDLSL